MAIQHNLETQLASAISTLESERANIEAVLRNLTPQE